MKNNVVGEVYKPTPEELVRMYELFDGQGVEIRRQFREGTLNPSYVQALIEHRNPFESRVSSLLKVKTTAEQFEGWTDLYKEIGIILDVENLQIPDRQPGFNRLIVVAKGMTNNRAYDECKKRFSCWKYTDDLDTAVPTNDRSPQNGTYAIWVRDRVEADEELKNKSADMIKAENIKGITLLERLLHELKYFTETGKHLDLKNWTLCSGSRRSDGDVPRVGWCNDKLGVSRSNPDDRNDGLRSRAVVTL